MHGQGAWWLHRFYPSNPAPGTYAISAANLMGGIWNNQSDFAYFRKREPDAVIGHTIFVYTIEPHGSPVDLSLAGLQIDQIDPETYRRFGTNDVRPRWFDASWSFIAAPGESWVAVADDQAIAPELMSLFDGLEPVAHAKLVDEDRSYRLYHVDLARRLLAAAQQADQQAGELSLPAQFGDTAELLGYTVRYKPDRVTLLTYWRASQHVATPLQMFVHLLDAQGNIVAQSDRLDAAPFGWRAGDIIAQVQHIDLPSNVAAQSIALGLYNSATQQRVPVVVDSREVDQQLILKQLP
jgi:hypothetical protein